jgi:hypothetical protein
LTSVGTVNSRSALRGIDEPVRATGSKTASAERKVQHPPTTIRSGAHEPPPQSSERGMRGHEINQLINVMRLSGPIIANLVPEPKPTLTRMIDMALEFNP